MTGISTPILEDHGRLPHLEGRWLTNLRHGLITIKSTIKALWCLGVKVQCKEDKYLMDKIREDTTLTDSQIKTLNYCQLYLDVDLLSDITTGDGKRLVTKAITQQGK
eukprot:15034479-Ditylum_brightwellii.AAC.1